MKVKHASSQLKSPMCCQHFSRVSHENDHVGAFLLGVGDKKQNKAKCFPSNQMTPCLLKHMEPPKNDFEHMLPQCCSDHAPWLAADHKQLSHLSLILLLATVKSHHVAS